MIDDRPQPGSRTPPGGGGALPRRVVALGGGTGMPSVLRGLRRLVGTTDARDLTAVVTMTDDGGSSGRLRRSLGVPPPGDLRNCLVALAADEDLLASLFQHRFAGGSELDGHSVGNLILAGLIEQTGCVVEAMEVSSRVLRTVGRILPSTADNVQLEATLEDGTTVVGETRIGELERGIRRIRLVPSEATPAPGVVESILGADLVVVGPGSLYTSILPHLAVRAIADALASTTAPVVLVGNLVSERGEASGLSLTDHVRVIEEHAGAPVLSGVLVHRGEVERDMLLRYRAEGATPLQWPGGSVRAGFHVVEANLLGVGPKMRHDPEATALGLLALWRETTSPTASRSA